MSLSFLLTSLIVIASGIAGQHRRGVRLHARHSAEHGGGDVRAVLGARLALAER